MLESGALASAALGTSFGLLPKPVAAQAGVHPLHFGTATLIAMGFACSCRRSARGCSPPAR